MNNDNWTNKFIKKKLPSYKNIKGIRSLEKDILLIKRKEGVDFKCIAISMEYIGDNIITEIIAKNPEINFIANIKVEYVISGFVLNLMDSKNISFGGFGDLIRFSNQEENSLFVNKEYYFVSRGLRQHNKIKKIERLDNKRIKIERYGLGDVTIAMNNDYEFNIESVRRTKEMFKNFKVILSTNPSAGISSDAYKIASTLNVNICKYGEFLGKINSYWNE